MSLATEQNIFSSEENILRAEDKVFARLFPAHGQKKNGAADLEEGGKRLHAAIVQEYQALQISGRLQFTKGSSADVSTLVGKHIPEGMPFKDAGIVLRAAGMQVASRLSCWEGRDISDEPHIRGELVLGKKTGRSAYLSVVVYPEKAGWWSAKVKWAGGLIGIDVLL